VPGRRWPPAHGPLPSARDGPPAPLCESLVSTCSALPPPPLGTWTPTPHCQHSTMAWLDDLVRDTAAVQSFLCATQQRQAVRLRRVIWPMVCQSLPGIVFAHVSHGSASVLDGIHLFAPQQSTASSSDLNRGRPATYIATKLALTWALKTLYIS
jgi:hypothetical protein